MKTFRRVVSDYLAQYPDPIRGAAGTPVLMVRTDERYLDWVWCRGRDEREGWVPLSLVRATGMGAEAGAVLLRDYDATELSVRTGEQVTMIEEVGGWGRATSADGKTGWVPLSCLGEP